MSIPSTSELLLVIIALLIGLLAAVVGGILAKHNGATFAAAAMTGSITFGGTVTLAIVVFNALSLL
jgi:hypothetical protein